MYLLYFLKLYPILVGSVHNSLLKSFLTCIVVSNLRDWSFITQPMGLKDFSGFFLMCSIKCFSVNLTQFCGPLKFKSLGASYCVDSPRGLLALYVCWYKKKKLGQPFPSQPCNLSFLKSTAILSILDRLFKSSCAVKKRRL